MKKCPYCAEEIQDEAVKCRFCGESQIMNRKQVVVLWLGIAVIVLMGLFPPVSYEGRGVIRASIRYEFILDAGRPVAISNILVQWTVVAITTGSLIYLLKDDKSKDKQKQ